MLNRLLHAQNIVPVHPVEYILPENLDALPELPMMDNGDGTYYCDGVSSQDGAPDPENQVAIINTYPKGTYKAVCGDKTYKVVLDDDLRSIGDTADRLWIDTRKWKCWADRKVAFKEINGMEWFSSPYTTFQNSTSLFVSISDCTGSLGLCNKLKLVSIVWAKDQEGFCINANTQFHIRFKHETVGITVDMGGDQKRQKIIDYVSEQYKMGTPLTVQYALKDTKVEKLNLIEVKAVNAGMEIEGTVNDAVDVLKVYGESRQAQSTAGTNLADIEIEYGNIDATDGKDIISDVRLRNIGYIDVKPGEQYTLSINTTNTGLLQFGFRFYAEDETFISTNTSDVHVAKDGIYSSTFQVPEGATKFRFVFTSIDSDKIAWLNLGTIAKDYETFTVDSPSPAYPQPIESVDGMLRSYGRNLFDKNLWDIGKGTSCAGAGFTYQIASGRFAVATINLKPGQKYTFTINNDQYWLNRIIEADENNICTVNHVFYRNISESRDRYTWTTNSKTTHAVFSFRLTNESAVTQNDVEAVKFMLMEGDEQKQFERYRGSTITLPTLRGLPDGTRDVLTIDRAQKRAWVERRVKLLTVNTAKWNDWRDGQRRVLIDVLDIRTPVQDVLGYCNIANTIKANNVNSVRTVAQFKTIYWYPNISELGLTGNETIEEANAALQAFLSQTPFVCTYALAEPVTEEIPWSDDLLLLTNQYYTSITADSDLDPDIEMQVKILGNR